MWAVPKKREPGQLPAHRMEIDYRQLNANTRDEQYPVPRLEDALDRMSGATIFSTLALKAGYHQIRICEEDMPKTAFSFE